MTVRRIVDGVTAASGRAAVKRGELGKEPRMVEQFYPAGILTMPCLAKASRGDSPPQRSPVMAVTL